MGHYRVMFEIEGERINRVKKQIEKTLPDCDVKIERLQPSSRAERLSNARCITEELLEELQQWRDNLPENLQSGAKAEELATCIDSLEELLTSFENVDFPSMI